jgi:hypothetical protein
MNVALFYIAGCPSLRCDVALPYLSVDFLKDLDWAADALTPEHAAFCEILHILFPGARTLSAPTSHGTPQLAAGHSWRTCTSRLRRRRYTPAARPDRQEPSAHPASYRPAVACDLEPDLGRPLPSSQPCIARGAAGRQPRSKRRGTDRCRPFLQFVTIGYNRSVRDNRI